MGNIMPARPPIIATTAANKLSAMGKTIRAHRKALRINATTAAEAAGMSRVTLHRIENGEPSVTIGAYLNAMAALNLDFGIIKPTVTGASGINPDNPLGYEPTVGASLLANNFASKLAPTIGKTSNGQSGIDDDRKGWIPARIHLADYPQLKQLAWQVHGTDELTPAEALSIYERNWRHVDVKALEPRERQLVDALRIGLGEPGGTV